MYATIHPIEPFDASIGTIINFTWNGNQIHQVKCTIKNNETGEIVYMDTISSMKQQYNIPANSGLINGTYYVAYITVFDVDGNESSIQDIGTPFYCFTTPEFSLSIRENDIVKASAYQVSITYSHSENEILDSYEIILYSYGKTQLQSSGTIYNTDNLTYTISSLENANQYYIRAIGTTLHGMALDTGYILFSVSYIQAQLFSTLELNNRAKIGAIEYKSNIISTEATSEKEVEYIDGTKADLRDNSITFDVGFEVSGDFTKIFKFEKPNINEVIVSFTGEGIIGNIYYREGEYSDSNGFKAYFELVVDTYGTKYVRMSNYVNIPDDSQQFSLLVNKIGNYYDLKVVLVNKTE